MTAGQRGEDERKVALSLREREQPGLRCMTHTFPVISLCSQWLWLGLQGPFGLKNPPNPGAKTPAATSGVWPPRLAFPALRLAVYTPVPRLGVTRESAAPTFS